MDAAAPLIRRRGGAGGVEDELRVGRIGAVLHVRPGQVHHFEDVAGLRATLVVFQPAALPPGALPETPWSGPVVRVQPWHRATLRGLLACLSAEAGPGKVQPGAEENDAAAVGAGIARHLLGGLCLAVRRAAAGAAAPAPGRDSHLADRLRTLLEEDHARSSCAAG